MAGIHRRLADEVFDRLHERIVIGDLAPGDRVDATDIAESLGVSRTPVREAILRLDAQGLVERQPYRGVVVTAVDPTAAEEVTALRVHLETLAARIAVPRLRPAHLEQMEEVHHRLEAALQGPEAHRRFNELNQEFHLTLYRTTGSPSLVRLIEDLSARAERIRLHFDVRRGPALHDHAAILAACRAGDVEAVVAATRDHIVGAFRLMLPAHEVAPGSAVAVAMATSGAAATAPPAGPAPR